MILKDLSGKRDLTKQHLQGMEKAVINYSAMYKKNLECLAKIEELRAARAPGSTNSAHQYENEMIYLASKEVLDQKLPKMRDAVEQLKKNRTFQNLTFRVPS